MKVKVEVSPEYQPPYAVIYTDAVTEEVKRAMDFFSSPDGSIIGQKGEQLRILKPAEIYMVRVEDGESVLYTDKEKLQSRKRLYELAALLGSGSLVVVLVGMLLAWIPRDGVIKTLLWFLISIGGVF